MRLALIIAVMATPAYAMGALRPDFTPTAEQIAACPPDAYRLCGPDFPDPNKITQCMVRAERRHRLSDACRAVFK